MISRTRRTRRADRGASAVEYGLMVAAIAGLLFVVVFAFGDVVSGMFTHSTQCLQQTAPGTPTCPGP
jgi:pilus assembly protein Flp/PilA